MTKIIPILSLIVLLAVLPTGSQELNGPGAFNTLESPSTQEGEEYHPPKEVPRKKTRHEKHLYLPLSSEYIPGTGLVKFGQVTPSIDIEKFTHRPIDGDHKKPIQHLVDGDHKKPIQHPVDGDHKKPIQHPVDGDHGKPILNPINEEPSQHLKNDKSKHRPRRTKRRKQKGRFTYELEMYRKMLERIIKYGAPIYYPSILNATNVTPDALRTRRRKNDRQLEKYAKQPLEKYYYTTSRTHRHKKKSTTPVRPKETTSIYGPTFRPLGPEYTNSYYATFTFPTKKKKKTVSPTTNFIQAYLATAFGRRPKTTTPQTTTPQTTKKKNRKFRTVRCDNGANKKRKHPVRYTSRPSSTQDSQGTWWYWWND